MTNCTCNFAANELVGAIETFATGPALCDFCTTMLWAAELEQRINALPTLDDVRDHVGERNYMDAEQFESEFERLLGESGCVTENDLERDYEFVTQDALDEAIEGLSMDDYVTKDELQSELGDALETALQEADIVQDVAAGAAKGAMAKLDRYALASNLQHYIDKCMALELRLNALEQPKPTAWLRRLLGR